MWTTEICKTINHLPKLESDYPSNFLRSTAADEAAAVCDLKLCLLRGCQPRMIERIGSGSTLVRPQHRHKM